MLAVAHAAAACLRMDRFGPLPGGRGELGDRFDQLAIARVARAEQGLPDVERQVRVYPRVNHVLKKPAMQKAAAEQRVDRRHNRRGPGGVELQGVVRHERPHGAGVDPPMRRRRDAAERPPRRNAMDAAVDRSPQVVRLHRRVGRCIGIAAASINRRRAAQPGFRPKIVPVVMVVRAQVFGAEPRRQQPRMERIGVVHHSLLMNPFHGPRDGRHQLVIEPFPRQLLIAIVEPKHLPVRIPLSLLRAEVAVPQLPVGKLRDHPPAAISHADRQQRVHHDARVAEPEAAIGIRPRHHVVGGEEEHRLHSAVVQLLEPSIGELQLSNRASRFMPSHARIECFQVAERRQLLLQRNANP